jgi:hypothetical protein
MTSTQNWTEDLTTTSVMSEPTTTSTTIETTTTTATTLSMIDIDVMCGNGSRADDLVQVLIAKRAKKLDHFTKYGKIVQLFDYCS